MESDIAEEQSGDLGKLFRALATAARPASNNVDSQLAEKEAQELYDVNRIFKKILQLPIYYVFKISRLELVNLELMKALLFVF